MNYVIALNKEKEKIRKQIREKQQLLRGMKTDCLETHLIKAELRHLTSLLFDMDIFGQAFDKKFTPKGSSDP